MAGTTGTEAVIQGVTAPRWCPRSSKDIVQEKRGPRSDPWGVILGTNAPPVHLPYTIKQWKDLEGFNGNRINHQQ